MSFPLDSFCLSSKVELTNHKRRSSLPGGSGTATLPVQPQWMLSHAWGRDPVWPTASWCRYQFLKSMMKLINAHLFWTTPALTNHCFLWNWIYWDLEDIMISWSSHLLHVWNCLPSLNFRFLICKPGIGICVRAQLLQLYQILCKPMDGSPPGSSVHGDSPGSNAGVSCHALLRGISLTQGWSSHLHCRWILYCWAPRKLMK